MENNEQNTTAQETPVFGIEKLYVRDLSVEVPNAPEIFLEQDSPQVEIGLNTSGRGVADGVFEVVLTVTVTAKLGDKTVFLVEVGQAGIRMCRKSSWKRSSWWPAPTSSSLTPAKRWPIR